MRYGNRTKVLTYAAVSRLYLLGNVTIEVQGASNGQFGIQLFRIGYQTGPRCLSTGEYGGLSSLWRTVDNGLNGNTLILLSFHIIHDRYPIVFEDE